jgi:hypothetical protein
LTAARRGICAGPDHKIRLDRIEVIRKKHVRKRLLPFVTRMTPADDLEHVEAHA